ncbi:MAG: tol-pal system protein YbgF [Alphaproteobacteria bacterium]|nr:tol-pal system protein YbgF [Alphaproteobacteria bacterium]
MKKQLILSAFAVLLAVAPAQAGLFGESDEEKAARQHEKDQDAAIADLTQRIHDLEDSLRQSTGQNEVLAHQIQQLNDKIARQQKDFEYRLCTVVGQQMGAGQDAGDGQPTSALPCPGGNGGGVSSTFNAPPPRPQQQSQAQGQNQSGLAPPPGNLGTLPAGTRMASAGPSGGHGQFDQALDLLAKARYDDARSRFRAFADANPEDEMAPEAIYWIGDIAFVQKDYAGAAHAFLEQMKKYPTSTRSPASMLKLGQSLIAMGQTKEGCMTLGALTGKYPNASKQIASQAASERKASCH